MSSPSQPGFRFTAQSVLGLLIIAVGLLLTADNLNWLETENLIRFWPIGVILAGAVKFAQSPTSSGRIFGGFIVFLGMLFAAEHTLRWPIQAEEWWLPVALIVLGAIVIFRTSQPAPAPRTPPPGPSASPPISTGGVLASSAAAGSETSFSEVAVWAGKQRRHVTTFRRADLTAIMGGIELDLRGATTVNGEAIIDLFVMWGGIEIWVPPDWAVSNQVGVLMAGAEDKSSGTQAARHRLIVRGFAVMGGVEIKT